MRKVEFAETWTGENCIAVRNKDGSYRIFIDPETVSIKTTNGFGMLTQVQVLSDMPSINNTISDVKTQIANQLLKEARENRNR